MPSLHDRIARELGWSVEDTQSYSLRSLRDVVRSSNPALAKEIERQIQSTEKTVRGKKRSDSRSGGGSRRTAGEGSRPPSNETSSARGKAADKESVWYHGGPRITDWGTLRWDRDRGESDLNAEGPGLYLTTDFDEAAGYMARGVIIKAKTRPGFRFVPKKRPSITTLRALYDATGTENQEIFLGNWGIEKHPAPPHVVQSALAHYTNQDSLIDAAVTLYHDLFRYDAKAFVEAMVGLGFDGFVVEKGTTGGSRRRKHLIVWNPRALQVEELG